MQFGSIKDDIFDMVDVAYEFLKDIIEHEEYLKLIMNRYNISNEEYERIKEIPNFPYNLMIAIGESKNIVKRGNEVDLEKVSKTIIQDLRKNRIGNITLERVGKVL